MTTTPIDEHKLFFLRGVLAAFASNGQVVHYDEVRRLCRLTQQQMGRYLGEARSRMLRAGQPDFCSLVVKGKGLPGTRWAGEDEALDPAKWAEELRKAHRFWRDRRAHDNPDFEDIHGALPEEPG